MYIHSTFRDSFEAKIDYLWFITDAAADVNDWLLEFFPHFSVVQTTKYDCFHSTDTHHVSCECVCGRARAGTHDLVDYYSTALSDEKQISKNQNCLVIVNECAVHSMCGVMCLPVFGAHVNGNCMSMINTLFISFFFFFLRPDWNRFYVLWMQHGSKLSNCWGVYHSLCCYLRRSVFCFCTSHSFASMFSANGRFVVTFFSHRTLLLGLGCNDYFFKLIPNLTMSTTNEATNEQKCV